MILSKVKLIRSKLFHLIYRNYAAKAEPITVKPLPENLSRLYDRHKHLIFYSSIVEDSKLKLGYRRNKIIESLLKKEEKYMQNKRVDTVPLSLAAKLLSEHSDKDEQNESPIELIENVRQSEPIQFDDDRKKIAILKKLQCHKNVVETLSPPEGSSWMKDYETFDDDDSDESLSKFGTPGKKTPKQ